MKVHTVNVLKATAIATFGALLASTPAFAASIINGDFESSAFTNPTIENFGSGFANLEVGNTTITGFTAIAGNQNGGASYIGRGVFQNNGVASRTVALNGAGTQGGISTTVTGLTTGQTLAVSFDLSSNPGAVNPSVSVSLVNGGAAQTFAAPITTAGSTFPINLPFTRFVTSFLYTGTSTFANLNFTSQSGTNLGPILDNVAVGNTTTVPFEFSPATGFVAGGILLGSYKLIKRRKAVV